MSSRSRVIMPGESIPEAEQSALRNKKVILGPGIRKLNDSIVSTKAGVLYIKNDQKFWIDNHQMRYIPIRFENVIGVVTQKSGDIFRVDIGASDQASLSYLAFEGATKKNRPNVSIGSLIYGKLIVASPNLEPELVCVDSHGKKDKLGVLEDGFLFKCSINLVRKILTENCPLLRKLQEELPFEIAVGMNGRIWIRADTLQRTIALGNAILAIETLDNAEIPDMCENIGNTLFNAN